MNKAPGLAILPGPLLAERTTLELGGRALAELRADSLEGLEAAPGAAASLGGRLVALGEGSNILADDGDLPLVLLTQQGGRTPLVVNEGKDTALVLVDASTRLPVLLGRLAAWGLSGLEGLAGIPGSVGGALAMNAGSYGSLLSDALEVLVAVSASQGIMTLDRDDLELGYRHMSITGHTGFFCIDNAELRLRKSSPEAVRARMREIMTKKRATQPVTAKSAGCVFKNPSPEQSAGKLLDEAGCKGFSLGGMAFSTLHANFLVNLGGGTTAQALELIDKGREAVRAMHGVTLELEVVRWP